MYQLRAESTKAVVNRGQAPAEPHAPPPHQAEQAPMGRNGPQQTMPNPGTVSFNRTTGDYVVEESHEETTKTVTSASGTGYVWEPSNLEFLEIPQVCCNKHHLDFSGLEEHRMTCDVCKGFPMLNIPTLQFPMNNREPEERLIVERRKREITQITSPRRRRRHGTLRRASVTEQEQLSPAVPPLDLQSIVQEDTSIFSGGPLSSGGCPCNGPIRVSTGCPIVVAPTNQVFFGPSHDGYCRANGLFLKCRFCQHEGYTIVEYSMGCFAYCWMVVLIIFTIGIFAWVPFCFEMFFDQRHICSRCRRQIAYLRRCECYASNCKCCEGTNCHHDHFDTCERYKHFKSGKCAYYHKDGTPRDRDPRETGEELRYGREQTAEDPNNEGENQNGEEVAASADNKDAKGHRRHRHGHYYDRHGRRRHTRSRRHRRHGHRRGRHRHSRSRSRSKHRSRVYESPYGSRATLYESNKYESRGSRGRRRRHGRRHHRKRDDSKYTYYTNSYESSPYDSTSRKKRKKRRKSQTSAESESFEDSLASRSIQSSSMSREISEHSSDSISRSNRDRSDRRQQSYYDDSRGTGSTYHLRTKAATENLENYSEDRSDDIRSSFTEADKGSPPRSHDGRSRKAESRKYSEKKGSVVGSRTYDFSEEPDGEKNRNRKSSEDPTSGSFDENKKGVTDDEQSDTNSQEFENQSPEDQKKLRKQNKQSRNWSNDTHKYHESLESSHDEDENYKRFRKRSRRIKTTNNKNSSQDESDEDTYGSAKQKTTSRKKNGKSDDSLESLMMEDPSEDLDGATRNAKRRH